MMTRQSFIAMVRSEGCFIGVVQGLLGCSWAASIHRGCSLGLFVGATVTFVMDRGECSMATVVIHSEDSVVVRSDSSGVPSEPSISRTMGNHQSREPCCSLSRTP
jgi:hypothetical protein